jgi:hypothetical protein
MFIMPYWIGLSSEKRQEHGHRQRIEHINPHISPLGATILTGPLQQLGVMSIT